MTTHNKIGLMLSGGGAKGAYQVGVWKAIREIKLDKKVAAVSGTSVGALNGLLFCLDDYDRAERIWRGISKSSILYLDGRTLLKNLILVLAMIKSARHRNLPGLVKTISAFGCFSREGLVGMLDECLQAGELKKSPIPLYACAYNVTRSSPESIYLNRKSIAELKGYLLASSAIPGIFPPERVGDDLYVDGTLAMMLKSGISYEPLAKREKCNIIINVTLTSKPDYRAQRKYPEVRFINIHPHKSLLKFGGILRFSVKASETLICNGYEDAMRELENLVQST